MWTSLAGVVGELEVQYAAKSFDSGRVRGVGEQKLAEQEQLQVGRVGGPGGVEIEVRKLWVDIRRED